MTRLELLSQDLFEKVLKGGPEFQRTVAQRAARTAIKTAPLTGEIAALLLKLLERSASDESRREVSKLVEKLEAAYFAAQEADAQENEILHAFMSARAANAVYFALSSDPAEAASEALYEAHAVIDDFSKIVSLVSDIKVRIDSYEDAQ